MWIGDKRTTNIPNCPLFKPYRKHFMSFGFKTGWAIPIYKGDDVIGAFAIYHKDQRHLRDKEIELIQQKIKDRDEDLFQMFRQLIEKEAKEA